MSLPPSDTALPMRRLLYKSEPALAATAEDARDQVAAIAREASMRNAEQKLTGALLYYPGLFVQVLEGPLAALEAHFRADLLRPAASQPGIAGACAGG